MDVDNLMPISVTTIILQLLGHEEGVSASSLSLTEARACGTCSTLQQYVIQVRDSACVIMQGLSLQCML